MRFRLPALAAVILASLSPCWGAEAELPGHPLTLEECVALALARNPSLRVAAQQVRSAQAGLTVEVAAYYPSAVFIATRGRTAGTSFLETPTGTIPFSTATERREAEVLLSQTVWETGRLERVRGASGSLAASVAQEEAAARDLTYVVGQRYYAALAAEQLASVAEANLAAAREHEKLVRARIEVGEAPPVEDASAEADVAEAELAVLQSENEADLAKAELKREMGVRPTFALELAAPAPVAGEAAPSLEAALELAQANRPELRAARESVGAAEQQLSLARKTEHGTLRLSADYDVGLKGPKEDTDAWAVVLTATGFLFDGGARGAQVEQSRSQLESLLAQEQETLNTIGLEVERARLDLETASKSVEASAKSVASAEVQLAAAQGKYREGVGISVEILDAERAVVRARTSQANAMYQYQTAVLALTRVTGTLDLPAAYR